MTLAFIERLAILLPDENADPECEVQAEHTGPANSDPDCSNRLLGGATSPTKVEGAMSGVQAWSLPAFCHGS